MKQYIRYEIGVRPHSSNIIKGIYLHNNDNGKAIEKSDIVVMSGLSKKEGDSFINKIFENLYK